MAVAAVRIPAVAAVTRAAYKPVTWFGGAPRHVSLLLMLLSFIRGSGGGDGGSGGSGVHD